MKNLVKCKACNNDIAKGVNKCPQCGKDQRNFFMKHKILTLIGVLMLLIVISNSVNKPITSKTNNTPLVKTEQVKPNIPLEYSSALIKAEMYVETMHMSKKSVYGQLTSEYGEKFSKEAAQYAIENIKTDYNKHALAKAKTYQETMHMSPKSIYDQLISEYGEKFTKSEAEYAIENLNKN